MRRLSFCRLASWTPSNRVTFCLSLTVSFSLLFNYSWFAFTIPLRTSISVSRELRVFSNLTFSSFFSFSCLCFNTLIYWDNYSFFVINLVCYSSLISSSSVRFLAMSLTSVIVCVFLRSYLCSSAFSDFSVSYSSIRCFNCSELLLRSWIAVLSSAVSFSSLSLLSLSIFT